MRQIYPDLWQTSPEHPLASSPTVCNAFLLVREEGNVLFYSTGREAVGRVDDRADHDRIENLGGVDHVLLGSLARGSALASNDQGAVRRRHHQSCSRHAADRERKRRSTGRDLLGATDTPRQYRGDPNARPHRRQRLLPLSIAARQDLSLHGRHDLVVARQLDDGHVRRRFEAILAQVKPRSAGNA